jgi:hypothetical protein
MSIRYWKDDRDCDDLTMLDSLMGACGNPKFNLIASVDA